MDATPTETHRVLSRLPGTVFVTTNYDCLLETALAESRAAPPLVACVEDVEQIRQFDHGDVLKLHGTIDRPETMVLSADEYLDVAHAKPNAWKDRVKAWLQDKSVLMVGYGFGDSDVQWVLGELGEIADEYIRERLEKARELRESSPVEAAQAAREATERAEQLFDENDGRGDTARLRAVARLELATVEAVGQPAGRQQSILSDIDGDALPPAERGRFAQLLVQSGDRGGARRLLTTLTEEAASSIEAARQLLTLSEGELPEPPYAAKFVAVRAATERFARREVAGPFETARTLLADDELSALTRFEALQLLELCLRQSMLRGPDDDVVPLDDRETSIATVSDGLRRCLEPNVLPRAGLRVVAADLLKEHARWTLDPDDLACADRVLEAPPADGASEYEAVEFARPSSDALELERVLGEATGALHSADPERAVELTSQALRRWPDRPHLLAVRGLARLAVGERGRTAEDARAAFRLAPTFGGRLLRVQTHLALSEFVEAWTLVAPLGGRDHPDLIRLAALAASGAQSDEAVSLWQRYLDAVPDDADARVRYLDVLRRFGTRPARRRRERAGTWAQSARIRRRVSTHPRRRRLDRAARAARAPAATREGRPGDSADSEARATRRARRHDRRPRRNGGARDARLMGLGGRPDSTR